MNRKWEIKQAGGNVLFALCTLHYALCHLPYACITVEYEKFPDVSVIGALGFLICFGFRASDFEIYLLPALCPLLYALCPVFRNAAITAAMSAGTGASKATVRRVVGCSSRIFQACNICRGAPFPLRRP